MTERQRKQLRFAVDFSASAVFLGVYFLGGRDFMRATWAAVIVAALAVAVGLVVERRVAWLPLIFTFGTVVFGGLTIWFDQDWILKNRPTFMNLFISGLLLGGLALNKNPLHSVLGYMLDLPPEVWRTLTWRYGLFAAGVAVTNVVIWKTQTEATWVVWDTLGIRGVSAAFGLAQMPLLMKHLSRDEVPPEPPASS